jgi:hypothetical protein
MGSDLPYSLEVLRAPAIILVGTRTMCSPAPSRSRSRRRDKCRQSWTAHSRWSPSWQAQPSSARWSPLVALITCCPTRRCAFVDGDDGVDPLMRVDAEYQHVDVSLLVSVDDLGPAGRQFFVQPDCRARIKPRQQVQVFRGAAGGTTARPANSGRANPSEHPETTHEKQRCNS